MFQLEFFALHKWPISRYQLRWPCYVNDSNQCSIRALFCYNRIRNVFEERFMIVATNYDRKAKLEVRQVAVYLHCLVGHVDDQIDVLLFK